MRAGFAACALGAAFLMGGPASAAALKSEAGVNVYRGMAPIELELEGADASPASTATTVIIIPDCRRMRSRVRTQGFYSGHDGRTRRFTQGFYSGPPDLGARRIILLNRR